ncbi:MAG: hypothetical protein ACREA4_11020 [Nitrososphaera sp.]
MAKALNWVRTIEALSPPERSRAISELIKIETKRPPGRWRCAERMAEVFRGYRNVRVYHIKEARRHGLRIDVFTDEEIAQKLSQQLLPSSWDGVEQLIVVTGHNATIKMERTEVTVEGDKFENISQSIIATRGSIAKGIIGVRKQEGDQVADALQVIEAALTGDAAKQLSEKDRKEALELLSEIAQQGAKPDSSKSVLRSLAQMLWGLIEKVEPLSKACLAAWKVLEKIWA